MTSLETSTAVASHAMSGGLLSLVSTVGAFIVLGLPGIALVARHAGLRSPVGLATAILSGVAISLLAVATAGSLLDRFDLLLVLSCCLATALPIYRSAPSRHADNTAAGALPWLLIAVMLPLAISSLPLIDVGRQVGDGFVFRPFFNADFFKHLGITQAIANGHLPPVDPFGALDRVHYYWLQYLVPATALALSSGAADPTDTLLFVSAVQTVLLATCLFGLAHRVSGSPRVACQVVVIGFASLSMDGLALLFAHPELPWSEVARVENMEAGDLTAALGAPYHLAASTLLRLTLYIPQHQLALALFCAWLLLGTQEVLPATRARIFRWPLLIALPATSLLMGVPLVLMCGVLGVINEAKDKRWQWALAVLAALVLPLALGMVEMNSASRVAGSQFTEGASVPLWTRLALMPAQWISSFGFIAPVGALGAWLLLRRDRRSEIGQLPAVLILTCAAGYAAGELLGFGPIRIDSQLKLSFIFQLGLLLGTAHLFGQWHTLSAAAKRLVAWSTPLLLFGLLSPIADLSWHRCAADDCRHGPNEATVIPADDQRALTWMRHNLPRTAVVQQRPEAHYLAGGRDVWVPVFSGRALAASSRGTAVTSEKLAIANRLFTLQPADDLAGQARILSLTHIYLTRALDPQRYQALYEQYGANRHLKLVYENKGVSLWQLL